MKHLIKITLLLLVCSSNAFALNDLGVSVLIKSDFLYLTETDTIKNPTTDPKKTDPRKKFALNYKNADDIIIDDENDNYVANQLINVASDNLGVVYKSGGTSKNGFDCSGLVYSTFSKFNLTLPRSSHEMATVGQKIEPQDAKKGDLIFFINRGQKRINHVGMVVDVCGDEIKFIHSSTQSGVIVSSLKESYYQRTFTQINRVLE
ncbi:C40 family peptidase [Flavobacterium sp. j3]|uniref:C40 family peptidase n=1 Tax=Flavobacterium aureirubrum TaxID=3133147 RepID=A0ABU9N7R3_9FLAO